MLWNNWLLELFLLNFNQFHILNGDLWLTFIRLVSIQNRIKQWLKRFESFQLPAISICFFLTSLRIARSTFSIIYSKYRRKSILHTHHFQRHHSNREEKKKGVPSLQLSCFTLFFFCWISLNSITTHRMNLIRS